MQVRPIDKTHNQAKRNPETKNKAKKPVTDPLFYQRCKLQAPSYQKHLGLTAEARCRALLDEQLQSKKAHKIFRCIRNEKGNK